MDKVIKNYDEAEVKPMNTREFIRYMKALRKEKKAHKGHNHQVQLPPDEHVCGPECQTPGNPPPADIELYSVAIVLDDVVADVMNVQAGFGEILLKGPKFIKLEEGTPRPQPGSFYVDGVFKTLHETIGPNVTLRGF